ncbi:MAG: hypothetical protein Rubg2KO_05390 [Rubricoccaceae bacterium]
MAILLALLALVSGPPDWQAPAPGTFSETMSITGVVQVSGAELRNSGDRLAAFVNGEIRGVASPTIVGSRRMFFLSVAGEDGDGPIAFKAYDAVGDRILDLQPELTFDSGAPRGSPSDPVVWTPRVGGGPPDWSVNASDFASSMTVTARVVRAGETVSEEGAQVGAFLGGELRGSAPIQDASSLAFLNVYGDDTETGTLIFQVYLPSLDQTVSALETVPFDEGTSAGTGSAPVELTIAPGPTLDGVAGWRMLAPPGASTTVNAFLGPLWTQGFSGADISGGTPNVYAYDETTGTYDPAPSASSSWARGTGRFVYVYADDDPTTTATDTGFPKALPTVGLGPSGPFTFALTRTVGNAEPQGPGWNLLGNPFDQAIDWDDAGWTKTGVSNSVYVWDPNHNGGSYRVWNGTAGSLAGGIVPAGNAFWVEATANGAALDVAESAKVGASDVLGVTASRPDSPSVIALHLRSEDRPALGAEAFLTFEAEGTDGIDPRDAWVLSPFTPDYLSLGTMVGDRQLAIDARGPEPSDVVVYPLAVEAVTNRQPVGERLVLSWPTLDVPPEWTLELVDLDTGTRLDLRRTPNHAFALAAGSASPRLELHVSPAGGTSSTGSPSNALSLSPPAPNPAQGTVELAFELATTRSVRLAVYDVLGREVALVADGARAAGRHAMSLDTRGLEPGVYVVRLVTGAEARTVPLTIAR